MMIDDLNDEMLREILCRLPCYRTALGYKTVSKRWRSLISSPLFITQGFVTHRDLIEKEPSFIFLLYMKMWNDNHVTAMAAPPCFQRTTSWYPILSLQFLPFHSKPVATFRDLILSFGANPLTGSGTFYICNPLTKQWIVLPQPQMHPKSVIWAALVCLEGRGFRVVVANSYPKFYYGKDPFIMINVLIYISETCQWRNTDVRFQLQSGNRAYQVEASFSKMVVYKRMVCIYNGENFGGFNPFEVTNTFHGTLTAIDFPLPHPSFNFKLLESDGKLVACCSDSSYISFVSDNKGKLIQYFKQPWQFLKFEQRLENDKQVVNPWELISQLDAFKSVRGSILVPHDRRKLDSCDLRVVGVHPTNQHLVYLIAVRDDSDDTTQHRLILLDTKSKSIEAFTTTIPPHAIWNSYRLDIPSWPTPIPIP